MKDNRKVRHWKVEKMQVEGRICKVEAGWYNGRQAFRRSPTLNLQPVTFNLMKHLWSPWRMKYIENHGKEDGCVFCNAQAKTDGAENLIAFRGELAYVILNRFPYASGHVMVVPFQHKPNIEELDSKTRAEMMELTSQCTTVLRGIYKPHGFNIGANIGEAAGAGVLGHVHIHIVPRWNGDTNFMSALGETRVLPEALEDTYQRIKDGFKT
jgi:ATP adenylyltransferase